MDTDGVPFITKFAEKKARLIVALATSIQLNESLFVTGVNDEEANGLVNEDSDDEDGHAIPNDYNMVREIES